MHRYGHHQRSSITLAKAKEKYPWLFTLMLRDESREARYWLLEELSSLYNYRGKLHTDSQGRPEPISLGEKIYWSLSHTDQYVAYIISDATVGIDIVEIQEREKSVLLSHTEEEYSLLSGKNWVHFYILWSAKEAIIKKCGGSLDDMSEIRLESKLGDDKYIFEFRGEMHRIEIIKKEDCILSYTV